MTHSIPNQTVLILGASGRFGSHSARAFQSAGWTVKRYDRATADMAAAAMGCDVIVNGLNPPNYHEWARTQPAITRNVIAAARASRATVILPGNVYHFGAQPGVWSEHTPPRPNSRKGAIRLTVEQNYRDSGVQTIVLRGGNAMDPDRNGCHMTLIYLRALHSGKITTPGPTDIRQAMCYLPDWARAAVELAQMRDRLGQFEDIPFEGHTLTGARIKAEVEAALGRPLTTTRFPWWLFTLTAPVWELARELREMRYLWETDHALSPDRFRALLPDFRTTPLPEVIRAVLPPEATGHALPQPA